MGKPGPGTIQSTFWIGAGLQQVWETGLASVRTSTGERMGKGEWVRLRIVQEFQVYNGTPTVSAGTARAVV